MFADLFGICHLVYVRVQDGLPIQHDFNIAAFAGDFLLIPLSLGWAALAAKRRWARVLGLCVSGLLLLIFLIWIAAIRETFVSVH